MTNLAFPNRRVSLKPFPLPVESSVARPLFAAPEGKLRRKLSDMTVNLHCSILGTCLPCSELRRIVVKVAGSSAHALTDHEIHQEGVRFASQSKGPGKLLQKALDTRHAVAVRTFEKANTAAEVLALWNEARTEGEVPGAYWAALTHPATDGETLRRIFGDVHMLSHLVGSANRADIRRLADLEAKVRALRSVVERQEARLRTVTDERDQKARALETVLWEGANLRAKYLRKAEIADTTHREGDADVGARYESAKSRRAELEAEKRAWQEERRELLREVERLKSSEASAIEEARALENALAATAADTSPDDRPAVDLSGLTLLYVGGHAHLVPALDVATRAAGAAFLHHDGGKSEALSLVPGLVSRADVVVFPLDCVSHGAVGAIKKSCRQLGRMYVPIPRSGLGSLLRLLETLPLAADSLANRRRAPQETEAARASSWSLSG